MSNNTKEKRRGIGWYIKFVLGGNMLSRAKFKKHIPFGIFLLLMIILFISNTFVAEDRLRAIKRAKEKHRIARIKAIEMRTKLMTITRPSVLYDAVKDLDLEEPADPPRKIITDKPSK